MWKRPAYIIPTVLLVLIGLYYPAVSDRVKIDSRRGEILELLLATDTQYADGYSYEGLLHIRKGMTEREVLDLLGEPLTRWRPHAHTRLTGKAHFVELGYSISPSSNNYRLRAV